MALVQCNQCGTEWNDMFPACPKCQSTDHVPAPRRDQHPVSGLGQVLPTQPDPTPRLSPPPPPPQQPVSPDGLWRWDGAKWVSTAPVAQVGRRKTGVFLWIFLAVQALFVWWLFAGVGDAAQSCQGSEYQAACETGAGLGAILIIMLWAAVDVILGIGYGVYRMATR